MAEYQKVRSSHKISMTIVDYMDNVVPAEYGGANRAHKIREINDILQGRSRKTVDDLLAELTEQSGGHCFAEIEDSRREIQEFQMQRTLRTCPYIKTGSRQYDYKLCDLNPQRPLKVIDQEIFDQAANDGFPPDFFKESYFDHVVIYCMPDGVDCSFSHFRGCSFAVCGIRGAVFDYAAIYDTDIHSALLQMVNFTEASLVHTRFRDSSLVSVSFQDSYMKACQTIDCTMDRIDFRGASLDGCSYGRITASSIRGIHAAAITQGGATEGECRRNRAAIFRALRPYGKPRIQTAKVGESR